MTNKFEQVQSYAPFLYHITELDNLPTIAEAGLKSHNRAHSDYAPTDISLPSVQENRGSKFDGVYGRPLHDYVPLYFRARNPMLFLRREKQPRLAVLYIDSAVLLYANAVFTDGNAASENTKFFCAIEDLDRLDWECLEADYWSNFDDGKRKRCAEVLVPHGIPRECIRGVVVSDESAQNEIASLVPWPIKIKPEWFF